MFATSTVTDAAVAVAEETESDIDPQTITSRRVGRVLRKMRLERHREAGGGPRGWLITTDSIRAWAARYGFPLPRPRTPAP